METRQMGLGRATPLTKLFSCFAVVVATALLFVVILVDGANALTPPPPPSGIVFSFGDRLVRIGADGTDRRELTKTGPFDRGDWEGRTGDMKPKVSPDGSRLLFTRSTPDAEYGTRQRIMVANADGTGAKPILVGGRKVSYSSPSWMPDGNSVAVARSVPRRSGIVRTVATTDLDGKAPRNVFKLPVDRFGAGIPLREPVDIDVSPDGEKFLITVSNGYSFDDKYLVLVDRSTGKKRVVGKNARHGSFSPDGLQITYVSSVGNKGKTCIETDESSCVVQGDLYVQNIDGSGKRRLTRSRAAEENPSWAPDGRRIAFDANYNLPRYGAASEIYAIAPDGSCLSNLTNGVPAGIEPNWTPDAGRSDLLCGVAAKELVLSGLWRPRGSKAGAVGVWAGPINGYRAVSRASLAGPFRVAEYEDCVELDPQLCAKPPKYEIEGISVCVAGYFVTNIVGWIKRAAFGTRRGVSFIRSKFRKRRVITVFTGDALVEITGNRRSSYRELESQIDQLRPANSADASGPLPGFYLPKGMPKMVKAVGRMVDRKGVRKTAKKLKVSPRDIRDVVTFNKRINLLGPIKTKACSKWELDGFDGF